MDFPPRRCHPAPNDGQVGFANRPFLKLGGQAVVRHIGKLLVLLLLCFVLPDIFLTWLEAVLRAIRWDMNSFYPYAFLLQLSPLKWLP